jgi:hypothetical protein
MGEQGTNSYIKSCLGLERSMRPEKKNIMELLDSQKEMQSDLSARDMKIVSDGIQMLRDTGALD